MESKFRIICCCNVIVMIILKNFATFSKEDNSFVAIYKDCNVQKIDNNNIWGIEISEEVANRQFNKYTLDDNKNLIITHDNEAELSTFKAIKIQEIINYYQSDELRSFKVIQGDLCQNFIANDKLSNDFQCNLSSLSNNESSYEYCIVGTKNSISIQKQDLLNIIHKVEKYRKYIAVNREDHCVVVDALTDKDIVANYNFIAHYRNGSVWKKIDDIVL